MHFRMACEILLFTASTSMSVLKDSSALKELIDFSNRYRLHVARSALGSAIVTEFEQLTDSASAVQLVSDLGSTSSFSSHLGTSAHALLMTSHLSARTVLLLVIR